MNENQLFAKFFDLTTQFGQKWIFAIVLLLIFWFGGKILQSFVTKMAQRKNLNKDFLHLIARVVKIVMILLGSITALGTLGVDVSALVAGLGLTGFALGFALKDIVSNLIAGAMILIHHPFRLDDFIAVGEFEGTVVDIDLRYTTIQDEDRKILIPNSTLFKKEIALMNRESNNSQAA